MPKKTTLPRKIKPRPQHGGRRKGSGRPKGTGNWGEETWPLRIPLSLYDFVKEFLETSAYSLPLYASRIPAGHPTLTVNDLEDRLRLSKLLLRNPQTTFLLQVTGDSMINAGIDDGDMIFVDHGLEPASRNIVVASINGEVTVKRLHKTKNKTSLLPENTRYEPIDITKNDELVIHGVVTKILKTPQ